MKLLAAICIVVIVIMTPFLLYQDVEVVVVDFVVTGDYGHGCHVALSCFLSPLPKS